MTEPTDDITNELLDQSEGVDSDELAGSHDGDEPVDPPEDWAEANRFGTTEREAKEGESLDQKLAEEVPDVGE